MFGFLKRRNADPKASLKAVLGKFQLPTFPAVVMETMDKVRDPKSDANAIAKVLSMDPNLSVQVLKTVNSAAFAARRKIQDISQAVALMGMSSLETLLLSVSVGNMIPRTSSPCYRFEEFWWAAGLRASMARGLADILCPANRFECFTAGLLQDMAIPFLATQKPTEYADILQAWRAGQGDLAELERKSFPWDHAEVATWICSEWDLPETLGIAIGEHHGSLELGGGASILPVKLVAPIRDTRENDGVDLVLAAVQARHPIDGERLAALVDDSRKAADELMRLMTG